MIREGRPNDPAHPAKLKLKNTKRYFRREQRQAKAKIELERQNKIVEASQTAQSLFFTLIRTQRRGKIAKISKLLVKGEIYDGENNNRGLGRIP